MTTIAVLSDPPVEGCVLSSLVESTALTREEATRLYRAMLVDVCRAIQSSAGDLLVNYRDADQLPVDVDSEAVLRDALGEALRDPDDVRYEIQVGETFAGRVGNTVTHLLEQEGEDTVAAVEPTAPFLDRELIGSAAMKLRSSEVVLGPTTRGRVSLAAFAEPIDFTDAYAPPATETLTERGRDAGLDVDFLPMTPVAEREAGFADVVVQIRSRLRAGRNVPERTARVIDDLGLAVEMDEDQLTVVRDR